MIPAERVPEGPRWWDGGPATAKSVMHSVVSPQHLGSEGGGGVSRSQGHTWLLSLITGQRPESGSQKTGGWGKGCSHADDS